jgi:hypothetical protein
VPVTVTFIFDDDTQQVIEQSIRVWQSGNRQIQVTLESDKKVTEVRVGSDSVPDVNNTNNTFRL